MHIKLTCFIILIIHFSVLGDVLIHDNFSKPDLKVRTFKNGDWTLNSDMASCTQDDELYRKRKNHGPAVIYDSEFNHARISFEAMFEQSEAFVVTFTSDDKNKLFRFVLNSEKPLSVRAWRGSSKGKKPDFLEDGKKTPKLINGHWHQVSLEFKQNQCTINIDDFSKTYSHEGIGKTKHRLGLALHYGTISLKNVILEKLQD